MTVGDAIQQYVYFVHFVVVVVWRHLSDPTWRHDVGSGVTPEITRPLDKCGTTCGTTAREMHQQVVTVRQTLYTLYVHIRTKRRSLTRRV